MKKLLGLLLMLIMLMSLMPVAMAMEPLDGGLEAAIEYDEMVVLSDGIVDGIILDEYGARGKQKKSGTPTLSLPITIQHDPEETICFAILMLDPDSVPICGYEWVHWMAVNVQTGELPANASIDMAADFVQGKNDFKAKGYGGPTPPDKPHTYVITVYALDSFIDLKDNFSKKDFFAAIEGHILAEAYIEGTYDN